MKFFGKIFSNKSDHQTLPKDYPYTKNNQKASTGHFSIVSNEWKKWAKQIIVSEARERKCKIDFILIELADLTHWTNEAYGIIKYSLIQIHTYIDPSSFILGDDPTYERLNKILKGWEQTKFKSIERDKIMEKIKEENVLRASSLLAEKVILYNKAMKELGYTEKIRKNKQVHEDHLLELKELDRKILNESFNILEFDSDFESFEDSI